MDITGPVLGWASSTWARAGLGRELVSPWRTLVSGSPIPLNDWCRAPAKGIAIPQTGVFNSVERDVSEAAPD